MLDGAQDALPKLDMMEPEEREKIFFRLREEAMVVNVLELVGDRTGTVAFPLGADHLPNVVNSFIRHPVNVVVLVHDSCSR